MARQGNSLKLWHEWCVNKALKYELWIKIRVFSSSIWHKFNEIHFTSPRIGLIKLGLTHWLMHGMVLEEGSLTELFKMMDMFYIYTLQYHGHYPHVVIKHLKGVWCN